jgi:hypothetical protein
MRSSTGSFEHPRAAVGLSAAQLAAIRGRDLFPDVLAQGRQGGEGRERRANPARTAARSAESAAEAKEGSEAAVEAPRRRACGLGKRGPAGSYYPKPSIIANAVVGR